jgi:acyl carrier protein
VLGILNFYLAAKPASPLEEMAGTTRLVEDLGCDSLTMMDTVFMVETVFDLKLEDADLAKLVTIDDLRELLRRRVSAAGKASA